jgi:hypothetical protein
MRIDMAAHAPMRPARGHPDDRDRRTSGVSELPRLPGTTGSWRLVRGAVVGAAATGLAVAGHTVAGGTPVPWTTTVSLVVLLGPLSVWSSRLRWTVFRLLAVLLLGQLLMHAAFVTTGAGPAAAGPVHTHGHVHAGMATQGSTPALGVDLAMGAAHVAAAVATAMLLWRGESWLAGVLDALSLRVLRLLSSAGRVYAVRPQPVPVGVDALPRQSPDTDSWWRRGPPR